MRSISNSFEDWFSHWALPTIVVALTLVAVTASRWLMSHFAKTHRFALLQRLAPTLSKLIYVVGLKLFAETAPLHPIALNWLDRGIYVVGVLIILALVRRIALIAIEWSILKTPNSSTLQQGFIPLMRNLITLFVFFAGAIMILKRFNYDVMSLLTALGVGSLAVGLAAKDTLSNMISGFTLIIDRNLRPGDRVNLAGQVGDVEEIGLRSTRIRMGNGNTLIVPNAELVNTKILNLSLLSRGVSCSTTFKVPLHVPFKRVKAICLELIAQVPNVRNEKGVWVHLSSIGEGMQTIQAGFWVADLDQQDASISDFHERLIERLQSERISIHHVAAVAPVLEPTRQGTAG